MRNNFIKQAGALVILGAFALFAFAGCTTPDSNGMTVTMTPSQLGAETTAVVNAFKVGVAAFVATSPVTADVQTKITTAENAANALATAISTADVSTAASDALSVANGLSDVAAQIPGLPIEVRAGLIGFQILVAALEPVLNPTTVTPAPAALSVTAPAMTIGHMKHGAALHVMLVPNG